MLKITEQTPRRLVMEDRRIAASIFAVMFTLISVFSIVVILVQGFEALFIIGTTMTALRVMGLLVFIVIGIGFTVLGVVAALGFANGVSCVMDKDAEVVLLERMNIFRKQKQSLPIYAVSHLDVEENAELRVYGVFLVLLSGERLSLTTFRTVDEVPMRELVRAVRVFLRG